MDKHKHYLSLLGGQSPKGLKYTRCDVDCRPKTQAISGWIPPGVTAIACLTVRSVTRGRWPTIRMMLATAVDLCQDDSKRPNMLGGADSMTIEIKYAIARCFPD
jgi:hypothetical protein